MGEWWGGRPEEREGKVSRQLLAVALALKLSLTFARRAGETRSVPLLSVRSVIGWVVLWRCLARRTGPVSRKSTLAEGRD